MLDKEKLKKFDTIKEGQNKSSPFAVRNQTETMFKVETTDQHGKRSIESQQALVLLPKDVMKICTDHDLSQSANTKLSSMDQFVKITFTDHQMLPIQHFNLNLNTYMEAYHLHP